MSLKLSHFYSAFRSSPPTGVACAGPEPAPALTVRVGAVEIGVERGFDPQLLQAMVRALTS
ncbi:MAG: hypothetical protein OWU33_05095 [Firmicutes bacterium]|nr:hypothetical protein [Bacillota bacterium]